MNKWALIVDVAKCINCNNCVLATKDEHVGNDFPGYAAPQPAHGHEWISIERVTRGSGSMVDVSYVPRMCNHCDDAPCIKAAGDGSVYKRSDGIVIVDPVKARGRRDLIAACPYGAMTWNEEAALPQIWIFDAHLLDQGWLQPRCAQVCPTGALEAIKTSAAELQGRVTAEGLQVLQPELGTRPRVLYRNLHLSNCCFLGGTVVRTDADGHEQNVEGAGVELSVDEAEVRHGATDGFGDFNIDRLRPGSNYRLFIRHEKFGEAQRVGKLQESVNLGAIELPGRAS